MLLLHCFWGVQLPEFASAPALPPRKVSRPQPAHASFVFELDSEKDKPLQDAEWYWGDITR